MSTVSPEGELCASENGSTGLLSPARSEVSNGDAESISPRSSVSSEQSLTTQVGGQATCFQDVKVVCNMATSTLFGHRYRPGSSCLQLLLGHRPDLFTKTSLSAGSSDAYLAASPVRASKGLVTLRSQKSIRDQPAALAEALHTSVPAARSPAQVHAASAGTSYTLMQPDCEYQDLSCCQPDSRQQPSSDAMLNPTSSAPEHLQPLSISDSGHSSTLPVTNSVFLSTLSQPKSIRAPSPTSCPQGGTVSADSIHSSTGSLPSTPEASTHAHAQQPESLHSAVAFPISQVNHASGELSGTTTSASPPHAELGAKDSSDADLADPSNLQEGHHAQSETDLVAEPSYRSEHAAVVSESISRSADDRKVSEPASGSADAVALSEPASSLLGTLFSRAGSQTSNYAPHVTPLVAKPTVSESPSQASPTIRLSQHAMSAQDDSPETSETGTGTDAVPGPSTAGSDSPQRQQLEAAFGTDANPGPSTAGSDSPHTEQQATAFGSDAVPGSSTAGSDSPHTEQQVTAFGSDAVPGSSTAGSDSSQRQQLEAAFGTDANPGPSTAGYDSPQTEQQATAFGSDAVPGPSTAGYDSPQAERESSSAATSTSGSDEAAPGSSTFAQRLKAQKGTAVNATSWSGWFLSWAA